MRAFLHIVLVYLLALLLVGTSPVGTGRGAHQDQLLDALVPHVHFVNGQRLDQTAPPPPTTLYRAGVALGAGADATSVTAGLALMPPLPSKAIALPSGAERWKVALADDPLPPGRAEPPPDPPPTA